MKLTPYQTYCLYLAIKSHFTQKKYDYFKYQGAVKATPESFEIRRDRTFFYRFSKKYNEDEMLDFLVANFIKGKKWIGELLEDQAEDNYIEYRRRKQSITYTFDNELSSLFMLVDDPKQIFECKSGQYPIIIQEYLSGNISLETFTLLNTLVSFSNKFDKCFDENDVIWSKIRLLSSKLLPFISYDKKKIMEVLKKHV